MPKKWLNELLWYAVADGIFGKILARNDESKSIALAFQIASIKWQPFLCDPRIIITNKTSNMWDV